jgi:hypothetical protein
MKAAYDRGAKQGWGFYNQEYYYATILNAGRAYSLQRPDDPAYGELAALTVQIGAGIHYNPLTNHDGAPWWVREAALWVTKNSTDTTLIQQANDLLARVNAMDDDPKALAQYADEDATANLRTYPRDSDALLQQLEADWRGWLLTNDPQWRSLAFQRAAEPAFPIANLPTTYGNDFINAARAAVANVPGYTSADRDNAKIVVNRLTKIGPLRTIASVKGVPHDVYMTTLAPADEYFGRLGYSILGIENQLKHINFMLDYNYGNRESTETLMIVEAILDMQKVYPADRDMSKLLYDAYTTLQRMNAPETQAAAARVRSLLTVEYQDSKEAHQLLNL